LNTAFPILALLDGNLEALKNVTSFSSLSVFVWIKKLECIKVGSPSGIGFQNIAFQAFEIAD
jgi:hypothetical protein